MKKLIALLILSIALSLSSTCAYAADEAILEQTVDVEAESTDVEIDSDTSEEATDAEPEAEIEPPVEAPLKPITFPVVVNGTTVSGTSVFRENVYYLPLRSVFERLGSFVYYRSRDRQILALSRDGDMIRHIVGTDTININGVQKTFAHPSLSENNVTYMPLDMIRAAFCASTVSCGNGLVKIQMPFANTEHNKLVNDVLWASKSTNFYPEKFKRYINYHAQKPASTMADVIFTVNLDLDYPVFENVTTISNPYSLLVLVNKHNKLPAGFAQTNLVNMDRKYTISDGKQYLMKDVAYQNFAKMSDAARTEGLSLKAISTYRTEDYQKRLYNNRLYSTGQRNADNYTARPGYSEHQTGLAVDINSTGTSFERTREFSWLQNHAHEYGYILRYPKNKTWITGYAYEPWHYRYVGVEAATIIHKEGSTYEQYYAKYIAVNEFK